MLKLDLLFLSHFKLNISVAAGSLRMLNLVQIYSFTAILNFDNTAV